MRPRHIAPGPAVGAALSGARLSRRALTASMAAGLLTLPVRSVAAQAQTPVPETGGSEAADTFTPVMIRPLAPVTAPVYGDDGRYHLLYDLWLTNG